MIRIMIAHLYSDFRTTFAEQLQKYKIIEVIRTPDIFDVVGTLVELENKGERLPDTVVLQFKSTKVQESISAITCMYNRYPEINVISLSMFKLEPETENIISDYVKCVMNMDDITDFRSIYEIVKSLYELKIKASTTLH